MKCHSLFFLARCRQLKCSQGETCDMSDLNNLKCSCVDKCSFVYEPVCANDGKTYASECLMNREVCLTKKEIKIVSFGYCSK